MDTMISGDNPAAQAADTPAGAGHAAGAGTSQVGGQPDGQAGHADGLFEGFDPNKLPPELRTQHDNMVRQYRSKTEKLSETLKSQLSKEYEPLKKDAELYKQLLAHPEFVERWNKYAEEVNAKQQQAGAIQQLPPEVQEKLQKVDRIEQEFQEAQAERAVDVFKSAVDDKGELLHPNFEKFSEIQIGTHAKAGEYSLLRAAIELAPGETLVEKMDAGYKLAEAAYNQIFEEGKKAGMGRLQAKVLNSTQPPSNGAAAPTTTKIPKNAHEAMRLARQGIRVQG